jgi:SAM-dependent methyltransferase
MDERTRAVQISYDRVAAPYAARFSYELAQKPLDRALLDYFAEQVRGRGPVVDVGCGPGQVAYYLHTRGVPISGLDLSPEMVAHARRLAPQITFRQGSLVALDAADATLGGIVAFYSIIHVAPDDQPRAMREFNRALRPGGLLMLAFHLGREIIHLDEWWDQPVDLDFHFYDRATITGLLEETGFTVEAWIERQPYASFEHPSQRAYLFARKPQSKAVP